MLDHTKVPFCGVKDQCVRHRHGEADAKLFEFYSRVVEVVVPDLIAKYHYVFPQCLQFWQNCTEKSAVHVFLKYLE